MFAKLFTNVCESKGFSVKVNDLGSVNKIDLLAVAEKGEKSHKYYIELKERGYSLHRFDNEGWVMEMPKKEELLRRANEYNATPLYVSITDDGYTLVWDVSKVKMESGTIIASRTTVGTSDWDKEKIRKDRYFLKNEDAKIYRNNDYKLMNYGTDC